MPALQLIRLWDADPMAVDVSRGEADGKEEATARGGVVGEETHRNARLVLIAGPDLPAMSVPGVACIQREP